VLYLNKKRAHPKIIFLVARSRPSQRITEIVEFDSPVGEVMSLLESRGMAEAFMAGVPIYCKRKDGSTVPLEVDPQQSIESLENTIMQSEVSVTS